MSDQPTIFEEPAQQPAAQQTQQPDQTVTSDQGVKTPDMNQVFADKLAQITNDQGEPKYSNVFTALEALKATQDHVRTLEDENRQFREEQTKAVTMDEVLQHIAANKAQDVQTVPSGLDAESVKGVTRQTLQEIMAEQVEQNNRKVVADELKQKFGSKEKAEEQYIKKAQELNLPMGTFNQLASSSPTAILKYFDVKGEVTPTKNVEGSVNTEALGAHKESSQPRKNIMYGASTSDIVDAWRATGQTIQNELEIN